MICLFAIDNRVQYIEDRSIGFWRSSICIRCSLAKETLTPGFCQSSTQPGRICLETGRIAKVPSSVFPLDVCFGMCFMGFCLCWKICSKEASELWISCSRLKLWISFSNFSPTSSPSCCQCGLWVPHLKGRRAKQAMPHPVQHPTNHILYIYIHMIMIN